MVGVAKRDNVIDLGKLEFCVREDLKMCIRDSDNTDFDPTSDELGILYKDGHDVYGVEVWTPEEVSFTDYYLSLIHISFSPLYGAE